jgi:hypothetical protein
VAERSAFDNHQRIGHEITSSDYEIADDARRNASIGAESASLQVIAPIDATERSISLAKQSL